MNKLFYIFGFLLLFFLSFFINGQANAASTCRYSDCFATSCNPTCTASTCGQTVTCQGYCPSSGTYCSTDAGKCDPCSSFRCTPTTTSCPCSPSQCGGYSACQDGCGHTISTFCGACPTPQSCTVREETCSSCSRTCGGGTQDCLDTCNNVIRRSCNTQACGVTRIEQDCRGGQWVTTSNSCVASCSTATPAPPPQCNKSKACGACGVACGNGNQTCRWTEHTSGQGCSEVIFNEPCSAICPPGQSCVAQACVNNYTITGDVFIDTNVNTLKDAGESNYSGSIDIRSTGGTVTTGGGAYTVSATSGSYTISYNNLPTEYTMTYPLNGPPPSFSVSIGPSCSSGGSNSASCTNGSIINLNFGITNNRPWFQCQALDCRIDSGFINRVPPTAVGGPYASIAGSGGTPGLVFTGNASADFGQGQASSTGWVAGGLSYPENYGPIRLGGQIKTSYNYLLARATQGNITPVDISTFCTGGLSSCTLPPTLPNGLYRANGNLNLNAFTFPSNKDFIILVNGDLTINGRIAVPVGSTAIFSTTGNITVASSVGEAPSATTATIQGVYSSDRSFIVAGANNCSQGPDLRLNIAGTVITNAAGAGGSFQSNRDLCGSDPLYPTVQFQERADFILNTPAFLRTPNFTYQELAP